MPVYSRYTDARAHFAAALAGTEDDGMPTWPVGNVRLFGFDGTLTARAHSGQTWTLPAGTIGPLFPLETSALLYPVDPLFPLIFSCNGGAADAVSGTFEYDWWLSQRAEATRLPTPSGMGAVDRPQYLYALGDHDYSGSMIVSPKTDEVSGLLAGGDAPSTGILTPGTIAPNSLALLFRHVSVYCRRRSDGAIQWARLTDS